MSEYQSYMQGLNADAYAKKVDVEAENKRLRDLVRRFVEPPRNFASKKDVVEEALLLIEVWRDV